MADSSGGGDGPEGSEVLSAAGFCPVLVDKNGDVTLGLIIKVASPFLFKLKYFDILVQFQVFKFL